MLALGTLGYESPEGSMYCIGNSLDVMSPLSTKADIFGFGLVMSLQFLSQDGPKNTQRASWSSVSTRPLDPSQC